MAEIAPPADTPFLRRLTARFSKRDLFEAALVGFGFLLYFGVRGLVIDRPETAYWHAIDVIDAERWLGIYWEPSMNDWVAGKEWLAQVLNYVYFYLHFPLIIVFGMWLYFFKREKYTMTRDSFLASGAIALVIYFLYPTAPPRVLPELAAQYDPNAPAYVTDFLDTMKEYLGYAYDTQSTRAFVNPYAAVPSLHFGWDMLLGLGLIWGFRGTRWLWLVVPVAIFLPALQVLSITMTANHFFLDAVAGGIVGLAGIGVAYALTQWAYPAFGSWWSRVRPPRSATPETPEM